MESFEVVSEESEVGEWLQGLEEVGRRIGPRFARIETRKRAVAYLKGLLSPAERKNGWQLAEVLGEETPYGIQHLLGRADWDADLVRDGLYSYVAEHLGDSEGVLVLDETGFLKKGKHSAGVARQYSGTAGRVENSQIGVFLAYSTDAGQVLVDRELYLPKEWTSDAERCRQAGVPEEREFLTKPQLAKAMIERAASLPFRWITADPVYGDDRRLRLWLEEKELPYVMAVSRKDYVWVGFQQYRISEIFERLPQEGWLTLSCGQGAKGPRVYEWFLTSANRPLQEGFARGILVRRDPSDPKDLQAFAVFAPKRTSIEKLVRVAGARWSIEICFEAAKGEVGLDHYEVRSYWGWYRHITLSMWALALLSVLRAAKKGIQPPPLNKGSMMEFKRKRGLLSH